jgi:hypothetical protein
MTLVIEVPPEVEIRLQAAAAKRGVPVVEYAKALLERQVLPLAVRVAALAPEEQDRLMAAAAEEAAELYNADLALAPGERELTAFTALDGEEFDMVARLGTLSDETLDAITIAVALCIQHRPTL